MNIQQYVHLIFFSVLVLQCAHGRDVGRPAHPRQRGHLARIEPVPTATTRARQLLELGQGVNEGSLGRSQVMPFLFDTNVDANLTGSIAYVVRGEPSWLSTLNTALLSKGKPALLWSNDLVNELYQATVASEYDLDRCAAPFNGSYVEGGTVYWKFRDYGVSPLIAGASAMAASYWLSVKAIPADVVNENANVLDALRTIYNGGFDTVATACVVEVCKTPGIDVYALITTCILDPGNPHGTSRTEQSAGCKRKVVRASDYNHSLQAIAQESNLSLANLACWNGLTSLLNMPRYLVVPCPEDVTALPVCPAWTEYNSTRNMSGYIIRGSEFWLDPVNQFTQLKSLNHLTWDTIHAVGIANLVYNTSVAAGRCGTTPSVGSNNNKWLFAAPTPASTLTASATEMLLGMYYTASTARLDDPSTFDGWSYEDVVRMRYLFGGQFGGGGPHIGCTVQVCNASFARPFCVADAPLGPWTSARGEGLPALKDVALARNATCRDAGIVKVNASQPTMALLARRYNRDLQQLLCWYPYIQTNLLPPPYIGLPCGSWVHKPTCDPLRLHLGEDVFKYTVQPFQNTSSVISTLQLDNNSLAACKLCCYNRLQPDNQRFPCEFAPMTTITVSRLALRRPLDGSQCPCIVAEPPEASRAALKQQAAAAAPSQAVESGSNVGLIVGVCVGALAMVLCVAMAAVVAVVVVSRRQKQKHGGGAVKASGHTTATLDALDLNSDHQQGSPSDTSSSKAPPSKDTSPRALSPLGEGTSSTSTAGADARGMTHDAYRMTQHTMGYQYHQQSSGRLNTASRGLGMLPPDSGNMSVFEQSWSGGSWRSNYSRSGSGRLLGSSGVPGSVGGVPGSGGGNGPGLEGNGPGMREDVMLHRSPSV